MSPRNSTPWTETESADLLAAAGTGRMTSQKWLEIALDLKTARTWQACRQRYHTLRRAEAGYVVKPRKPRGRVVNGRINNCVDMQFPPSPDALPRHASITAALFGDPLPGRSALDRRAQQ